MVHNKARTDSIISGFYSRLFDDDCDDKNGQLAITMAIDGAGTSQPQQQQHDEGHDNDVPLVDLHGIPLLEAQQAQEEDNEARTEQELMMVPLMMGSSSISSTHNHGIKTTRSTDSDASRIRSRRGKTSSSSHYGKYSKPSHRRRALRQQQAEQQEQQALLLQAQRRRCCPTPFVRSTLSVMNFLARVLFWSSVVATVAAVFWYSYELINNG
jgi:hypothetical protein